MSSERLAFVCFLILGVAMTLSFHSSGAVSDGDALTIAAFDGGITTSPAAPVTVRVIKTGAGLLRLVWSGMGVFQAAHLAAGLLLALAAALAACVAYRAAGSEGAGWAAGTLVAAGLLFGADTGRLGLEAGPASVLLVLLSGAACAWTAERSFGFLGGLLLGLALAEHPLVLLLLPGFGALALGGTLRLPPPEGGRLIRGAAIGFVVGLVAILLPLLDGRRPGPLLVSDPTSFGGALSAWWGQAPPAWTLAGPSAWGGGIVGWITALWRNAGPLGLALGLAGILAFFRGHARLVRPFLVMHGILALACVVGRTGEVAAALLAWSFLFWTVPTLVSLAGSRANVASVAAGALLFAMNAGGLNRSAERGVAWASTVLETAPDHSMLLTRNAAQLALSADGLRPDVDVVHLAYPSSLNALRAASPFVTTTAPASADSIPPHVLLALLQETVPTRPVLIDPGVYFRDESRGGTRSVQFQYAPHGVAFRVLHAGEKMSGQQAVDALLAWRDVNVTPDTPPSPLRGGLDGRAFFARGLQTAGLLFVELDRDHDAERAFLLALSHPDADRTAAAHGLAQIFFQRNDYAEAVTTLETWVRDDDPGAWVAYKLLSNSYLRLRDLERARIALQRALAVTPAVRAEEREDIRNGLERLERRMGS